MNRGHARRDTKRGAIRQRRERLHRLFYEMTDDERDTYPTVVGPRSMAARAVMIDALIEMGSPRTAEELRRLGRGKLGYTLLEDKIRRTIYGRSSPSSGWDPYRSKKPAKTIWLAVVGYGPQRRFIRLEEKDIHGTPSDGRLHLFEIGLGFSSAYKIVYADDLSAALEIAEERWPHLFLDELDEDDAAEAEDRGEDVFPHPTKRNVMVRRSDDTRVEPARTRLVRARVVGGPYDRTAVLLRADGAGASSRPPVVTYER